MSGLREALEELHKPLPVYIIDYRTGEYQLDANGNKVLLVTLCLGCSSAEALEAFGDGEFDEDCDYVSYPCETATILAAHPDDSVTEWGVVYYGSYSVRVDWGYASDPTPLIDAEGEFDLGAGSWVRPMKVVSRISSPVKTVWEAT